jgi:Anthranilate phosphoribosyltransferase
MARAASVLDFERAVLVHGEPGIDEVSVFGKTTVVEVRRSSVDKYSIEPRDLGLGTYRVDDVRVASPLDSVERFRRAVAGVDAAARDFIIANTAFALYVAGVVRDLRDGVELVKSGLDEGLWGYIDELVRVSRS